MSFLRLRTPWGQINFIWNEPALFSEAEGLVPSWAIGPLRITWRTARNETVLFLRSKGARDLAVAIESGEMTGSEAFSSWWEDQHASDCAVHNEPAYPNGPCDCGAASKEEGNG